MITDTVKLKRTIRMTRILFYLNALIWLVFGVISLYRLGSGESAYVLTMLVVAVLMFGNVAAMLVAGFVLKWPRKWSFWLATAVLLINIVLTFTDQVGLADLATLLLDLVILSLLIVSREWFGL
jgi:hypothetical protein